MFSLPLGLLKQFINLVQLADACNLIVDTFDVKKVVKAEPAVKRRSVSPKSRSRKSSRK
jgi:hypothetical protein